jgi:hypothetical protein
MRQEPEFFEDRPLVLVYIGKRLSESKEVEDVLTDASIDYAVEVDYYAGGVIFRRERAGAFFYVDEPMVVQARQALIAKGHRPIDEES